MRAHKRIAEGLVAMRADEPDDDVVVTALETGIDLLRKAGVVVWLAHAEEELGVWHLGQDRAEQAAPFLAAARATYASLGATRWLARLDAAVNSASGSPVAGRTGA